MDQKEGTRIMSRKGTWDLLRLIQLRLAAVPQSDKVIVAACFGRGRGGGLQLRLSNSKTQFHHYLIFAFCLPALQNTHAFPLGTPY